MSFTEAYAIGKAAGAGRNAWSTATLVADAATWAARSSKGMRDNRWNQAARHAEQDPRQRVGERAATGRGRSAAIPELSPQWKRNFSPINAQQHPCEHWVPQPMGPIQAPRRAFANIAVQQDLRH